MRKAVVIPAKTIGDALIFMIAANHLKKLDFDVTIMHDAVISLKSWFPDYNLKTYNENFSRYDHIIYQHDNAKSEHINKLKQLNNSKKFSIFYTTYKKSKHGPLDEFDVALSNDCPIAQSLALSCQKFYNFNETSLETQIKIPNDLVHKKYPKRILIHPLSSDKNKCWSKNKYIRLCKKLIKSGFQPAVCVAANERKQWLFVHSLNIDLPLFNTLADFASFLYESSYLIGNDSFAAHLASLLNIDHIVIAASKKLLKFWQPGWKKTNLIFPPSWMPNPKYLRLREKHFQNFISVKKVFSVFRSTCSNQTS